MALLGLALWLDGVSTRLTKLQKSRSELSLDVAKMQALVNIRKKIDAALKTTQEQAQTETQRGFNNPSPEEGATQWQSELQAQLAGLKIKDAQLLPAEPPKQQPLGPMVYLSGTFSAVPEQVVSLIQTMAATKRLYRVSELQLDVSPELDWPRLKVNMKVEGMYFPPEVKQKGGRPLPAPAKASTPAPKAPSAATSAPAPAAAASAPAASPAKPAPASGGAKPALPGNIAGLPSLALPPQANPGAGSGIPPGPGGAGAPAPAAGKMPPAGANPNIGGPPPNQAPPPRK